MSDNIVSGNKFAFGDPLSASVGVNFNLTVTMPDAYALTGKWATLTVSKFEDGPELFKLSEAGGGLTFNGQNIPVTINNDATNETAGGDTWHTLIETYRNLRFSLDVGDDSDTSHAEYRFQGDISTDPKRGSLPSGVEVGETVTPTLGGTTINVSLLGQQAASASESSGVNAGDDTDVNGLLRGDGATLSAATAAQVRVAADLDTTDSPTFDSLTLTGDIDLSDGAEINIGSTAGTADILGQITITPDGLYDQAISINGGNITLRSDGAMGCKSLTISTLRNYIHSSGPRVCNANVIGFVDHTTNAVSYSPNAAFSYGNPTNNTDRNGGAVIALGNGTAQDASGTLQLADIIASGNIDFTGLPTSDPAVAGRLWNDSGTLKISAG